ncbi:MAG: glycosyltransferase, partial [Acidobacteria bacterium]
MSPPAPDVTVVIPTRNRVDSLWHTLAALTRQTFPAPRFEVVVVDDAGTDGTARLTRNFAAPFALTVTSAPQPAGAAAARNLGARTASGALLLFLDDDIEASPGLLAAHVRAHEAGAEVTTGYLPASVAGGSSFFAIALRGWWEAMFAAMRQRGHRYTFRDLLTGNCAIDASLFRRTGGFDERLACHEDYELGVRLIGCGARFQFVEDAWGFHHERTTLERALLRKRAEGKADVQILERHPDLWTVLPIGFFERHASRRQRALRRLALTSPASARLAARSLRAALRAQEGLRLRGRWTRALHDLLTLAYWEGVNVAVGGRPGLERLRARMKMQPALPSPPLEVDLASGLRVAMRRLDEARPHATTIRYREESVGTIPAIPGAEALRGEHLQASLARELAAAFLQALGRAGAAPV